MKPEKQIKDKLKEIQSDERLGYSKTNVFTNAPLALIQVELETKVKILKWILEVKE